MLIANGISLSCISHTISKLINCFIISFPLHSIIFAVKVKHLLVFLNIFLLRNFYFFAIDFNNFTNKLLIVIKDFLTNIKRMMSIYCNSKFIVQNLFSTKISIIFINIADIAINMISICIIMN